MRFAHLAGAVACLATFITAAPVTASNKATSPPLQITDLILYAVKGGNTTISFNVYDPDPLTNATAICAGYWPTNSTSYPQGSYEPCGNTNFAWNMYSYTDISSYVLGVEHVFEDPAVGEYPYDYVNTFAKASVTTADVPCKDSRPFTICNQHLNDTIGAPIYAEAA